MVHFYLIKLVQQIDMAFQNGKKILTASLGLLSIIILIGAFLLYHYILLFGEFNNPNAYEKWLLFSGVDEIQKYRIIEETLRYSKGERVTVVSFESSAAPIEAARSSRVLQEIF